MSHSPSSVDGPRGILYVVAMPLGNPEDISLRALRVLGTVDMVLVPTPDGRDPLPVTGAATLRTAAYKDDSSCIDGVVQELCEGATVALVGHSGTPGIDTPGWSLVRAAIRAGIPVVPIPGPSAINALISVTGFPSGSGRFYFVGDIGDDETALGQAIQAGTALKATVMFASSGRRLRRVLTTLAVLLDGRRVAVASDLTADHEWIAVGIGGRHADVVDENAAYWVAVEPG